MLSTLTTNEIASLPISRRREKLGEVSFRKSNPARKVAARIVVTTKLGKKNGFKSQNEPGRNVEGNCFANSARTPPMTGSNTLLEDVNIIKFNQGRGFMHPKPRRKGTIEKALAKSKSGRNQKTGLSRH